MTTVKELAEKRGVAPASLKRNLDRKGFKVGVNDEVTPEILDAISKGKPAKVNGSAPVQINGTKSKKVSKISKGKRNEPTGLFHNKIIMLTAASILIASDAMSFAWIAFNAYVEFSHVAAVLFAFVGMAVGYSAIKNVVSYDDYSGGWASGFGIFQVALHLCAMEVLGPDSFFYGKIVISVGLALATAGLAIALKPVNK